MTKTEIGQKPAQRVRGGGMRTRQTDNSNHFRVGKGKAASPLSNDSPLSAT